MAGQKEKVKVEGSKEKVDAYLKVLLASRELYEALNDPNVTLTEVTMLVEKKKLLAKKYQEVTSNNWPL